MNYNSKGGLLNPEIFGDLTYPIEVLCRPQGAAKVYADPSSKPGYEKKLFASMAINAEFVNTQYEGAQFMMRIYLNQYVELVKKSRDELKIDVLTLFLHPKPLSGYDWLKPYIYYDEAMKMEVGKSVSMREAEQFLGIGKNR